MDRLEEMIQMQRSLQERYGYQFQLMTLGMRVAYAKEMSIHLSQELQESLYELPFFKPWKDYSEMTEAEKTDALYRAQGECVDMWHFFMNYMLAIGLTPTGLYEGYKEKNQENYARQERGYAHDVSYREDANNDGK